VKGRKEREGREGEGESKVRWKRRKGVEETETLLTSTRRACSGKGSKKRSAFRGKGKRAKGRKAKDEDERTKAKPAMRERKRDYETTRLLRNQT
jgi:hypothetical protein